MTAGPPTFPSGSLNAVLDAFKAACAREWPPDAFELVNQTLADLAVHNEDDPWTLPLPATFVIDQHGIIRSADVRVDYRNRAEPAQTIAVPQQLRARR